MVQRTTKVTIAGTSGIPISTITGISGTYISHWMGRLCFPPKGGMIVDTPRVDLPLMRQCQTVHSTTGNGNNSDLFKVKMGVESRTHDNLGSNLWPKAQLSTLTSTKSVYL